MNWIVWSKFSESILDIGSEEHCKAEARSMNNLFQSNDYVAKPYIPQ